MKTVLLAKSSGESLVTHTAWCLKAARALLASLPLQDEQKRDIERDVLLAIALHDVGKAARGFQQMLRGEQKNWGGKRHEILSAAFASLLLEISPAALLAILTHHKSIPDDGLGDRRWGCLPPEQIPCADDPTAVWLEMAEEWRANAAAFAQEWRKICKAWERTDLATLRPDLAPLALAPAWLNRSTGKRGQRKSVPFSERRHAAIVRGLTIAADHLGSAHRSPHNIPDLKSFTVMQQEARPFQTAAADTTGSAILRAPTGSGKTEAAMLWAQRNHSRNGRLFYVLPYTASINAMYRRLGPGISAERSGVFGRDNVGLLHSRATAALYTMLEGNDDSSKLDHQENARTLAGLAHEMWFPIRVCTPHQLLRCVLRGKGWETMLTEFPNACFIFDEVHAYDPRIVGLTLGTARMVSGWGASSLFLSATLPQFLEKLVRGAIGEVPVIVPDPTNARDRAILQRKRHRVSFLNGTLLDHLSDIVKAVRSVDSTLIVCNHVATSQRIYEELQKVFGNRACLLHGRFNQEDRNRIEGSLSGLLPKVLVATQVVEVSLDVDFDQAFVEPAPIDAIVQRMGRVNRAGLRAPVSIVVFTEQVDRYALYCNCSGSAHHPACRVRRSIEELQGLQNPVSESDLVEAANRAYGDGYVGEDKRAFDEGLNHPDIVSFEDRLLAGAHQEWVEQVIEKSDGTVEVLPTCLRDEYESRRLQGLWVEANALLVAIRVKSLSWLGPKLNASVDPWLLACPYTPEKGLEL